MSLSETREYSAADFAAIQTATTLPAWARTWTFRREADGRPMLVAEVEGLQIWAQPKAWSTMTIRDEAARAGDAAGTLNYGLQLGQLAQHAGQLETNDSAFGRELLGARTGSEVPLPDGSGTGPAAGSLLPAAILAGGLVLAALVARFRRR